MSKVIVTGAAGFIGGQTVLNLIDQGHTVMAVDSAMPPKHLMDLIGVDTGWFTGDFAGELGLQLIKIQKPNAIIHCAGSSLVGPSVLDPQVYYENNFVKTKCMLDFLVANKLTDTRVIYSSSASVYGEPVMTPCLEVDPVAPISPYGESKLMTEWMLNSYARAYGINAVIFRYFNACGADSRARHGQAPGATHIIARVLEAVKAGQDFTLYGTEYETPDGTCVRDYVHVEDIAEAHILAVDSKIKAGTYNLGTNLGNSNLDVVRAAARIVKKDIATLHGPARAGDPAVLTADPGTFETTASWKAKYNLDDMIAHAWAWYNR
jgi:UDP-glucose 4-epimerase